MKIEVKEYNLVYIKKSWNNVFNINGKDVRVSSYNLEDCELGEYDNDYEINEEDLNNLTEEEQEFLDENIGELIYLNVGEVINMEE
jgi:hypothetical protein